MDLLEPAVVGPSSAPAATAVLDPPTSAPVPTTKPSTCRVRMRTDTFERLFEEYAERLYSFLAYRSGDRVLAEDLLADTFERVLRSGHRFDPRRGSEKQWIYTIALNLLRDHARRQATEHRALERVSAGAPFSAEDAQLEALGSRDELNAALATLSDDEREAIALRFGADLKLKEVARVLGEREDAVEGRIYRGLRKLRERLS
jgi:RNA polymerase sigma-70 factor, ECF subfamily